MKSNGKRNTGLTINQKQGLTGWFFLLPAALLIFAMNFYPMLQALVLSFKTGIGNNQVWGGLDNYARLLQDKVLEYEDDEDNEDDFFEDKEGEDE